MLVPRVASWALYAVIFAHAVVPPRERHFVHVQVVHLLLLSSRETAVVNLNTCALCDMVGTLYAVIFARADVPPRERHFV